MGEASGGRAMTSRPTLLQPFLTPKTDQWQALGGAARAFALAACVTTSIVYHAAAKGIIIRAMESRLESDIDLQGFLGLRDDIPRGFQEIRMVVSIDADASPEKLEEIVRLGPSYSPVYDTLARAVPVSVSLAK